MNADTPMLKPKGLVLTVKAMAVSAPALAASSCIALRTDLPDVVQFCLNGETTRNFEYARTLPGGDSEKGTVTYRVRGRFDDPDGNAAYSLTGHVDMVVTFDARWRI
jgi:hypothetical protein